MQTNLDFLNSSTNTDMLKNLFNRINANIEMQKDILQSSKKKQGRISEQDLADLAKVTDSIIYTLREVQVYCNAQGSFGSMAATNFMKALNDNEKTDAEKILSLVHLVNNMLEFMPDNWNHFYNAKKEKIVK